jgi:uncharacterized protein YjeT (DUF2065 family)
LIFVATVGLGAWQIVRGEVPIVALLGLIALLLGVLVTWQARSRERGRLELDAAMQAGTLLASPNRPAATTAALLALTRAGRADLAVILLVDLWPGQQVSTETAILVVDEALRSSSPSAQLVAAELLSRNARTLDPCQPLDWPRSLDGEWLPELAPSTKFLLLEALLLSACAAPVNRNSLRLLAIRLYGIWAHDPSLQASAGTAIEVLVPALERHGYRDLTRVSLAQLRRAGASAQPHPDRYVAEVVAAHRARLVAWVSAVSDVPLGNPVEAVAR